MGRRRFSMHPARPCVGRRARQVAVSHLATCRVCGWRTDAAPNSLGIAVRHAEHYGHVVDVETVASLVVDPTDWK